MTEPTDPAQLYRLLFLCFDAGVAYARGESALTPADAADSAIVERVRADWRLRMERPRPAWLAALIDAAPGVEPWPEERT